MDAQQRMYATVSGTDEVEWTVEWPVVWCNRHEPIARADLERRGRYSSFVFDLTYRCPRCGQEIRVVLSTTS